MPEAARQLGRPSQVENEPMNLKGVGNELMDLRTRGELYSKFGKDRERRRGACAEGDRGETEGDVNEKGGNGGVDLWLLPHCSSFQGGKTCLEGVMSSFPRVAVWRMMVMTCFGRRPPDLVDQTSS